MTKKKILYLNFTFYYWRYSISMIFFNDMYDDKYVKYDDRVWSLLAGEGLHKEAKQMVTWITDIFDMGEEIVYKGKPERDRQLFKYYLDKKARHLTCRPLNALDIYPALKLEGATDKERVPTWFWLMFRYLV